MQQLRHPAPVCRTSGHETGGGVAVRGAGVEPAGRRTSQSNAFIWTFPGTALDVSLSRRWLAAVAVALWGPGDDADRLVLAYSEVATNAVVHGRGPVTVTARIRPSAATCEVADCSPRIPEPRLAAPEDVSGRGLGLVAQTVDRLRVTVEEVGKTVAFEIGRRTAESGGSPVRESGESPVAGTVAGAVAVAAAHMGTARRVRGHSSPAGASVFALGEIIG